MLAGFRVEEDKLRIPSTKRVCLVGTPSVGAEDYEDRRTRVLDLVAEKVRDAAKRFNNKNTVFFLFSLEGL